MLTIRDATLLPDRPASHCPLSEFGVFGRHGITHNINHPAADCLSRNSYSGLEPRGAAPPRRRSPPPPRRAPPCEPSWTCAFGHRPRIQASRPTCLPARFLSSKLAVSLVRLISRRARHCVLHFSRVITASCPHRSRRKASRLCRPPNRPVCPSAPPRRPTWPRPNL